MTDEILAPTEKLKATRQQVAELSDSIGKAVTYDDDTTEELLTEAQERAINILAIIHDKDDGDMHFALAMYIRKQRRGQ